MTKYRFGVFIGTVCIIIAAFVLSFIYTEIYERYQLLYLTILGVALIPNFILRNRENRERTNIIISYYIEGNPEKFITLINDYNKKVISTNNYKIAVKTLIASAYIDSGNNEKAKEVLSELIDLEKAMSISAKAIYYLTWSKCYIMNFEFNHAKILLDQVSKMTEQAKDKNKMAILSLYRWNLSLYNISTGIYMEQAYNYFTDMLKKRLTKIQVIEALYFQAIVDKRKGYKEAAKEKFKQVIANGGELIYVDKSSLEIQKINETECF